MLWRKLNHLTFLHMSNKLCDFFLSRNVPDMNDSILTSWYQIFAVRGKWAFNDRVLILKISKFLVLFSCKWIDYYYHIISCCAKNISSTVGKFKDFNLRIIFGPTLKCSSLIFESVIKTYSAHCCIIKNLCKSYDKNNTLWIEAGNRIRACAILVQI